MRILSSLFFSPCRHNHNSSQGGWDSPKVRVTSHPCTHGMPRDAFNPCEHRLIKWSFKACLLLFKEWHACRSHCARGGSISLNSHPISPVCALREHGSDTHVIPPLLVCALGEQRSARIKPFSECAQAFSFSFADTSHSRRAAEFRSARARLPSTHNLRFPRSFAGCS